MHMCLYACKHTLHIYLSNEVTSFWGDKVPSKSLPLLNKIPSTKKPPFKLLVRRAQVSLPKIHYCCCPGFSPRILRLVSAAEDTGLGGSELNLNPKSPPSRLPFIVQKVLVKLLREKSNSST